MTFPIIRHFRAPKNRRCSYATAFRSAIFPLLPVRLQQLDYEKGTLELDGAYIDFIDSSEAQVSVKFGNEYHDLVLNQRYSMTKYFGCDSLPHENVPRIRPRAALRQRTAPAICTALTRI